MRLINATKSKITALSPKKIATLAACILAALTADAQMRVDGNIKID